jgi:hypothetical protein
MSEWSPLIYGRTYEVDFRFLAVPEDFCVSQQNWSLRYIHAMLQRPVYLRQVSRLAIFADQSYCVFGIACEVSRLASENEKFWDKFMRDKAGRPLYLFAGFVTKFDKKIAIRDIPKYETIKNHLFFSKAFREYFKELSKFETEEVRRFEYKKVRRFEYKKQNFDDSSAINFNYRTTYKIHKARYRKYDFIATRYDLNKSEKRQNISRFGIFANSETDRNGLWENACIGMSQSNPFPLSLRLGLHLEKDVLETPFLNATVDTLTDENEKLGESEENEKLELDQAESIRSQVFESENGKVNLDRFIKEFAESSNNLAIIISIVLGIIIVVRISPKVLIIGIIVSLVSLFFLKIIKIIISKLDI